MILEARAVDYGYPGKAVGRDASLTLSAGDVLVLLGPNGGGKSTLFRTLLGLLPAQGGRVLLEGQDIAAMDRKMVARIAGYVPQSSPGYFPFTVFDTVLMGRTARLGLFSSPSRHDQAVAGRILSELGIADLADEPYTRISGGQRQMVLIARALAQEPRLLVLDEPTASLDYGNQLRVLQRIRSLASGGMAILLSTHDPNQAVLLDGSVALVHDGRLTGPGPAADIVTPASLWNVYGVEVDFITAPNLSAPAIRPRLA
ncbi:ABC transporter ATP-binding protein [Telmatospirillum sp. J64-1]|uniref:ABC transporter ATP-binding protein n=1 Tax=Telmatospirillum sp. J64-1 TaxID=2502183 RepID=UPI00115F7370|nr:ABC transporter ATP-binding protein [Telmatospirillum sp. J64-1]